MNNDNIVDLFDVETLEEWTHSIPSYQRKLIEDLLEHTTPENAAAIWLDSSVENNSPFSSEGTNKRYYDYVLRELHKLLCGDPAYSEERKEMESILKKDGAKEAIISFISAAIGAKLGLASAFIAPAIVLLIIAIGKVTINAWCEMHR